VDKIGRDEILFTLGVVMLTSMCVAAVVFGRQADTALVTAAVGLLGLPVFLASGRKEQP
jgi:hypothetical protein